MHMGVGGEAKHFSNTQYSKTLVKQNMPQMQAMKQLKQKHQNSSYEHKNPSLTALHDFEKYLNLRASSYSSLKWWSC